MTKDHKTHWPDILNIADFLAFTECQLRFHGLDECSTEGICNEMEKLGITVLSTADTLFNKTENIISICEKEDLIILNADRTKFKLTTSGYEQMNNQLLKDHRIVNFQIEKDVFILARPIKNSKRIQIDEKAIRFTAKDMENISIVREVLCTQADCYSVAVGLSPNGKPLCAACLYESRFTPINKAIQKTINTLQEDKNNALEAAELIADDNSPTKTRLLGSAKAYGDAIDLLNELTPKQ
jgi:hypothetical protein